MLLYQALVVHQFLLVWRPSIVGEHVACVVQVSIKMRNINVLLMGTNEMKLTLTYKENCPVKSSIDATGEIFFETIDELSEGTPPPFSHSFIVSKTKFSRLS